MQTRFNQSALSKLDNVKQSKLQLNHLDADQKDNHEIIGVNVLSMNDLPENHPLAKKKAIQSEEEAKKAVEPVALPDPKKQKQSLKKA